MAISDETAQLFETLTAETGKYTYWAEFVNMLFALAVIVGFSLVTIWVLKRLARKRFSQKKLRTSCFRILERRALGPKSALYLVDILGKGVVIAESAAGGIQVVKEFAEGTNLDELIEELLTAPEELPSLREKLTSKFHLMMAKKGA